MCATINSWASTAAPFGQKGEKSGRFRDGFGRVAGVLAAVFTFAVTGQVTIVKAAESVFAQRAKQVYLKARASHRADPANHELAWRHARATFYWADYAPADTERAALAEEGIAVCRQLLKRQTNSAPGHYYLALNLGQLARTKTLAALGIVTEMETELKTAAALDRFFDYAGPDLALGILYRDAPGWPVSIGNRAKSREHLLRVVKLSPDYPENRLVLLESYLEWNDKKAFENAFGALAELLPRARKQFAGEEWEDNWADWDRRWEKLKSKAPPPPSGQ